MATETKLRQLAQGGCPVYYFYSSERYLVRQAVTRAAKLLAEGEDEETTVLDGAAPEIEQLIMAAGTISFFGTRRVVLLPEVDPAAYSDKDLDELCATLASLENAVVVLGSVFEMERNKLKLGKRAQKLIAQCTKVGFAEELAKPKPYELKVMMMDRAKAQDTTLSEGTAAALLERCGEDPFLLENEVDKLCALSGYQTVTTAMDAISAPVSLYDPVYTDGGDPLTVMDQVRDTKNTDEQWVERIALREAISTLGEREKRILALRFFDGRTQMEVASEVGISQAQVSRLEKNAIRTLRKAIC